MIYLYIKTHNKTGLKYLGKTISKNPFKYKGSGVYWTRHLKIHGDDISTEIIFESESKEEIKEKGIYYSYLWDVVNSKNWANLKIEEGDGGNGGANKGKKLKRTEQWRINIKRKRGPQKNPCRKKGPQSKEHIEKLSKIRKNKKWYNDGYISKTFTEGNQPENWVKGRLPLKKK